MLSLTDRLKNTWNAFLGRDPTPRGDYDLGMASYGRPDRTRLSWINQHSMTSVIYNRFAVDCSMIDIKHVLLDENDKFKEVIDSPLNDCLSLSANIDQTGRALIQDLVISMFDEGCVALVPVITSTDPNNTDSFKIWELRVGKIIRWYPHNITVKVYNEDKGYQEEITLSKSSVAIIENPFYTIMNEPNSVMQRLKRVLAQLDRVNEFSSSDKLDLIIQFPFPINGELKKRQAEERRNSIIGQLTNSKYGIAYIDGTEKVVQLNRSLENNLWNQALELEKRLYDQFGLTENILNGTADESEQLNYYSKTIEPIIAAITDEMKRKFLSRNAITRKQSILYFKDPFKLVPVSQVAEIADKFTRNEIMSSNEIRAVMGLKPSDDPRADELINANINQSNDDPRAGIEEVPEGNNSKGSMLVRKALEKL